MALQHLYKQTESTYTLEHSSKNLSADMFVQNNQLLCFDNTGFIFTYILIIYSFILYDIDNILHYFTINENTHDILKGCQRCLDRAGGDIFSD